jgi:peptide/nickel transport system substrate-binding protein
MLKKSLLAVLSVIVILGLIIGGCTQPEEPTPTPTPSPAPSPTPSPSPTPTPTPTPTPPPTTSGPQYGGTLRVISGAEVNSFMVGEMYSPEDFFQRQPSIETLVRYDPATQQPVPFLAEAVIEDPVAKTVTFKLRPGVTFHDGSPCNAQAIKWNLDQEQVAPNTAPDFVDVASIDVVDDLTLKVSFNDWDNTFLREMCWDSAVISPTAFEKNGLDSVRVNPVGTGPFKMVSFQRDVNKVFEKYDGYWQEGKPYLDAIEINIIADPTVQVASLLKHENDILTGLNPTDAKTLKDNPDVVLIEGPRTQGLVSHLAGDSVNPDSPFSNIKVRQAVSYAINRQDIVDYVYYGWADVCYGANSPSCWTYNPNIVGYPYNPEKARTLLAEAGYADGFDTTIWLRTEKSTVDMCTAIQSNLADVGINADLQMLEPGAYGAMFFGTGWEDGLFQAGHLCDPELGVAGRFFFSADAGIAFSNNIIHPDDLELALKNMMTTTDNDKKQKYAWEVDSLLIDKYCIVTSIVTSINLFAKSPDVHDDHIEESWTFADAWMEK